MMPEEVVEGAVKTIAYVLPCWTTQPAPRLKEYHVEGDHAFVMEETEILPLVRSGPVGAPLASVALMLTVSCPAPVPLMRKGI